MHKSRLRTMWSLLRLTWFSMPNPCLLWFKSYLLLVTTLAPTASKATEPYESRIPFRRRLLSRQRQSHLPQQGRRNLRCHLRLA
ncbi:hypothetical protein C8T65DRAFT_8966 [Cerioporus squamosus]|nr:hypothetical protein C8T65DRAFT_8966 [Cerioporus squamosus]